MTNLILRKLNFYKENEVEFSFFLIFSRNINPWDKIKFYCFKCNDLLNISFISNVKSIQFSTLHNFPNPIIVSGNREIEFNQLNHMIIIKYLAFLYCQYKNNKENFYLHYIKLLITFLGKKNSELIFFQLKYYFNLIILSKDVNKKENCLLKWNYFNDYEPILALRNKEFSQKLNFLKKIREYLKNGMIIEILQDVKNFSKYFDYKNIIYFVLLFVFKSLESLFKDDLFNYYYSGKDTSDILNLLLKIENSNAGIEELKENYLKKREIPLKCNKLNRKEIFTKENLLYLIYLIYQFLKFGRAEHREFPQSLLQKLPAHQHARNKKYLHKS